MKTRNQYSISAVTAVAFLVMTSMAVAQVNFSSSFSGTANWNWDGQVIADSNTEDTQGDPQFVIGGTDEFVLSASGGHANQDDDAYIYTSGSFDGTGITTLLTSFDVSFTNINIIQSPNEATTRFFEIGGTEGNQGATTQWNGAFASIGLGMDGTNARFGVRVFDRFGSANNAGENSYAWDGNTFRLELETTIDPSLNTITTSLDVFLNGVYQETISASRSRNANDVDFSTLAGYALGAIGPGSNNQAYNGDIIFDNFSAVIPEPRVYGLVAGLAGIGMIFWRVRRK